MNFSQVDKCVEEDDDTIELVEFFLAKTIEHIVCFHQTKSANDNVIFESYYPDRDRQVLLYILEIHDESDQKHWRCFDSRVQQETVHKPVSIPAREH